MIFKTRAKEHKRFFTELDKYIDVLTELATNPRIEITYCRKPENNQVGEITWIHQ